MTGALAWLDNSAEEQRRVVEFIGYFTEKTTLDEVGIGQIRDALSDLLFPGTSTIQTRARYFLIVPWCYLHAGTRKGEDVERELIGALSDQRGAFGSRSGGGIQRLPSDVYRGGLTQLGILRRDVRPASVRAGIARVAESDEFALRALGDWHPTIPAPPAGFPKTLEGGLDMTHEEAEWLRERVLEAVPDSLLAHLVSSDGSPDRGSHFVWEDPIVASTPPDLKQLLVHAERFSTIVDGMQRMYWLLLAEAQRERFGTDARLAEFQDAWSEYLTQMEGQVPLYREWRTDAFWEIVLEVNPRIGLRTRHFVEQFINLVRGGSASLDSGARGLVRERERSVKRTQSRFDNHRLLGVWRGSPGSGALSYRWPNVRNILIDIHEGRQHVGA